jgi:hypothetical protein
MQGAATKPKSTGVLNVVSAQRVAVESPDVESPGAGGGGGGGGFTVGGLSFDSSSFVQAASVAKASIANQISRLITGVFATEIYPTYRKRAMREIISVPV